MTESVPALAVKWICAFTKTILRRDKINIPNDDTGKPSQSCLVETRERTTFNEQGIAVLPLRKEFNVLARDKN
uniref:Uncharacterized protein n=1 Tax=Trichuris muris TaxID=70415 RepID=A0A5S6QCF2_TRIMR